MRLLKGEAVAIHVVGPFDDGTRVGVGRPHGGDGGYLGSVAQEGLEDAELPLGAEDLGVVIGLGQPPLGRQAVPLQVPPQQVP